MSILVFLAEGSPEGLRVVERSNWTGVVLICSAASPAPLLGRVELDGPGVYLLVGALSGDDSRPLYIGEADDVGKRIRQHLAKADERWQQIVVATRKDTSLNKAHVRWIEHELIARAREANRVSLTNANAGFTSALHEADVATLESYLEDLLMILPLLGIDAFHVPEASPELGQSEVLSPKGAGGAQATGYEKGSALVVTSGITRAVHAPSTPTPIVKPRERLLAAGVFLDVGDGTWRLWGPYSFDAPSTAASVMLGRSANGLIEWKGSTGATLQAGREARAAEFYTSPIAGGRGTTG